jgi:putative phage-type endonuclease
MNRELVLPAGADRDEWLALRRTGLGGSDVAAIVGLDPYKSPFSIWFDKKYGDDTDSAGESAEIGNVLEDIVARTAAARQGVRIRNTGTWRSKERPWQLANPDRLIVGTPGIFEVKTRAGAAPTSGRTAPSSPNRCSCSASTTST